MFLFQFRKNVYNYDIRNITKSVLSKMLVYLNKVEFECFQNVKYRRMKWIIISKKRYKKFLAVLIQFTCCTHGINIGSM